MNLTLKLLRMIGSPLMSPECEPPENNDQILELYSYASKNKIGLLYLETVKQQGKLEELGMESEYEKEVNKHNEQLTTLIRISRLFNSSDINYVIFKSIMPYPAVPNDVDVLHLGSNDGYQKAIDIMLQAGYINIDDPPSPSQTSFHDARDCPHSGPRTKDTYDVDLYRRAATSHITYLDREKLVKYVTEVSISGEPVKVLTPPAELVAIIVHSVVPEQLYTLLVYYATLYYLAQMDLKDIDQLIYIAKENNVSFAVGAHFSLTSALHQKAHGFIPEKLAQSSARLGNNRLEVRNLLQTSLNLPHHYSWLTVIRTLLERAKVREFRKGAARQTIGMLNPKLARWVLWNIIWRRRRETY